MLCSVIHALFLQAAVVLLSAWNLFCECMQKKAFQCITTSFTNSSTGNNITGSVVGGGDSIRGHNTSVSMPVKLLATASENVPSSTASRTMTAGSTKEHGVNNIRSSVITAEISAESAAAVAAITQTAAESSSALSVSHIRKLLRNEPCAAIAAVPGNVDSSTTIGVGTSIEMLPAATVRSLLSVAWYQLTALDVNGFFAMPVRSL